jgi:hypothetical protein
VNAVISPPGGGPIPSSGVDEPLVSVTLPGERYLGVARLVTAGVGARLDLPFEAVDDLQLAVELLLAAAFAAEGRHATIGFANDDSSLTVSVSPLDSGVLAATRAAYGSEERVQLRELLERLVDGVGTATEPQPTIVLRKALEASRP